MSLHFPPTFPVFKFCGFPMPTGLKCLRTCTISQPFPDRTWCITPYRHPSLEPVLWLSGTVARLFLSTNQRCPTSLRTSVTYLCPPSAHPNVPQVDAADRNIRFARGRMGPPDQGSKIPNGPMVHGSTGPRRKGFKGSRAQGPTSPRVHGISDPTISGRSLFIVAN